MTALWDQALCVPRKTAVAAHYVSTVSWMTAMAAVVAASAVVPLAFVGWMATQAGWSTIIALVVRPRVGELLVNTLLLIGLTIPLCAGVAIALAWLVQRSDLPARAVVSWLAVAPLAVPAFVHSYAWISIAPGFRGLGAGVLISALAYFPFLYLPVAAVLARLDPSLEDAAASLGMSPWRVFWRVTVPQLRGALCGGALLIGLHLLAEYGLFVMIRFDTFTTAIIDQFQSTYNGTAAHMLSAVLIGCSALLLGLERRLRGTVRYARLGSGAARTHTRVPLGHALVPCYLALGVIVVLSLGVPIVTLAGWVIKGGGGIWRVRELAPVLLETVALAAGGALVTTMAAFPIAWLSVRNPGRMTWLLRTCTFFVGSLPGVVVALAIVSLVTRVALPLYQTVATVVFAYCLLFLPRAVVSWQASIAQVPRALEDAASSLGRSPVRALLEITLRLAAPGAAAAMALVGLGITNELTATLLLAPNGTQTLATQFWAYSSEIDYASAAPYALLMVVASFPMVIVLHAQSKWAGAR